ncbi:hypothetical protein SLE2022_261880 [Rubroshorea leprosula]
MTKSLLWRKDGIFVSWPVGWGGGGLGWAQLLPYALKRKINSGSAPVQGGNLGPCPRFGPGSALVQPWFSGEDLYMEIGQDIRPKISAFCQRLEAISNVDT